MDKILHGVEGAVLGITSSLEMFDKLQFEGQRLEGKWHPYDAFNFVVTAWHLFQDWPNSDSRAAPSRQKRHRDKLPPEMGLVLDVLHDLTNGGKHFVLEASKAGKRKVETVHEGRTADWYSYFFHEDMPGVTVGQTYFSIRGLRNITLRYFQWVFDDAIPVKAFPHEIVEAVRHCDIANRPTGHQAPPFFWV